jgi:hypothetical protein
MKKDTCVKSIRDPSTTKMNKIILLVALFACAYGKNLKTQFLKCHHNSNLYTLYLLYS